MGNKKFTNDEVLLYERILFYQMNAMQGDKPDVVKLKDIEHFKLQYCIDRNSERIKTEAKRIRDAIEKSQTKVHRKLVEDFTKAFQEARKENDQLPEDSFIKTWDKGEDLKKEEEKFKPKREIMLSEESGLEVYTIPADSLDDDLPITGSLYAMIKPFLV